MADLGSQLVAMLVLTLLCVLIHAAGSGVLLWQIRLNMHRIHHQRGWSVQAVTVTTLVMGLIAVHAAEIGVFAATYLGLGAFDDLGTALYFSTASYATVGHGDLAPVQWRLLGAWEGLVGFILIGWSTALFITVILRVWSEDHKWFDKAG